MRRLVVLVSLLTILLVSTTSLVAAQPATPTARPSASEIPGRYIVVLNEQAGEPADIASELGRVHGFQADKVYRSAVRGFAGNIPPGRVDQLKADPRVLSVQPDRKLAIPSEPRVAGKSQPSAPTSSQVLPTGVDRIDAELNANKGQGIHVAIIDTGIDLRHPDLAANIAPEGTNCVTPGAPPADDNGHGTHVAGTVAAINNTVGVVGVAPQASLHAVKVLDSAGGGSWSQVICGIDWVTANAKDASGNQRIHVANMSLTGGGSDTGDCGRAVGREDALHDAICTSIGAGVAYVVAAGNDGIDAMNAVPAAYPEVITVAALGDSDGKRNANDTIPTFSNFGGAVDIAAPGVNIRSTALGGGYATMSGTSMASPHVAGSAALYLKTNPGSSPQAVMTALRKTGECVDGIPGVRYPSDGNHNGDAYTCASSWPGAPNHNEPLVRARGL